MAAHCPVCNSALPKETSLSYFAATSAFVIADDDVSMWREEAYRIAAFLGALATAAPIAIAEETTKNLAAPSWVETLAFLAEELAEELRRRVDRLGKAGKIWKKKVDALGESSRKHGVATAPEDEDRDF